MRELEMTLSELGWTVSSYNWDDPDEYPDNVPREGKYQIHGFEVRKPEEVGYGPPRFPTPIFDAEAIDVSSELAFAEAAYHIAESGEYDTDQ
jgi:hypothetical protein